ncbi:type VII secretion-associated serine protease mycosin [Streptomyces sp. NPDC014006]|uniref:type VII secretion-associated serine protease mycosin n=1 Tax=Streptomyces sp. NPDC014006 TaxID=3364870 RepID=UPI003702A222
MRATNWTLRSLPTVSAVLGLLLVGLGSTPAYADSVRARQWHLDAMHAEEMWKTSTGRGITVAVIDSGVEDSLADLKGQVLKGKDFSDQRGDEHTDIDGHGTGIAALIAGTGARGPVQGSYGLAPGAKILPVRMRYASEHYGEVDDTAQFFRLLAQAIRYAADSKAQIINMSLGRSKSPTAPNAGTPELAAAVKYAISKGKLLFAGVGNSGNTSNLPLYPASTPGVVGVGAITPKIKRAAFSEHGQEVDVTAPGVDMYHACPGGTEVCKGEGTSDATAIASASAALIWSKHPDWTNNQVLRVLINTMKGNEKGWTRNDDFGYGVVRPRVALVNPGDPGPADEYPLPDLAAAAVKSPSSKASGSPGAAAGAESGERSEAAASEGRNDNNTTLWIGLGIAAAVILGTAIVVPIVLRARRRRAAPAPLGSSTPPAYPSPYAAPPAPYQPPPYQPPTPQAPYQAPQGPGQTG